MIQPSALSPALLADLRSKSVDVDRALRVLDLVNRQEAGADTAPSPGRLLLPEASDPRVTDPAGSAALELDRGAVEARLAELGVALPLERIAACRAGTAVFDRPALRKLGILLYPRLAYGVLNGGSATSYTDLGKNRALDGRAFDLLRGEFEAVADRNQDAPKGLTPAYIETDGRPGPSFLLLKMRALLLRARDYRLLTGDAETPLLPFFQMTSDATDAPLRAAYATYREDPLLRDLIRSTGVDPTRPDSAVQGLLAALTHSGSGRPRRLFDAAYGKKDAGLALPGGHGENFRILAPVYRSLRKRGFRFAYLGNVDNSGYTVDPHALALLALRGGEGAFEFSRRTKVDVKGGVLTENEAGILSVADIGQAIGGKEVDEQEQQGRQALFNCATGLFDLDFLIRRERAISDGLPIRVSDQDKEAGKYAQAEQNTWEVLALMQKPLILAVEKEKRFLAAKLLLETLLASPRGTKIQADPAVPAEFRKTAALLNRGLESLMQEEYGFSAPDASGRRRPLDAAELDLRE